MTEEEFINRIKDLKTNVPDEEFFLEYNKEIYDILDNQEKLIKYIEDKIKDCKNTLELLDGTNSHRVSILQVQIKDYEDLLERIRSGKYD